ncbi:MAG: hypothetical protein AB1801_19940 [Chloroflexota bacterium]
MNKRISKKQTNSAETPPPIWRRLLLLLPLTPLVAGLLLIFGAIFGPVIWISPEAQTLLGGLGVLGSFAAFNAIQNQWDLAIGWLLLGVGLWLGLSWPELWIQVLAFVCGGLGLYFLSKEFLRRFRQQQTDQAKRGK